MKPTLFTTLPEEYVCTPDGMEIDKNGDLIVSCPNFADRTMPGCVIRITKDMRISKWFDVMPHPETGLARNMGIAFDKDYNLYICDNQGWYEEEENIFKGRVLKVVFDEERNVKETIVVADQMEHPNGIRIKGDYMYLTQSYLHRQKTESGKLMSCVYRFRLDDRDIQVKNTLEDENIFCTFITENPDCQYGADGIVFGPDGNLYVGNFGDGEVVKVIVDENGDYVSQSTYAKDFSKMESTDGMIFDDKGNLYVADFCANSIAKITPEGEVIRYAQSPDCDGLDGGLDQPGEPIIWEGKIIASCFDLVTGPGKVNTAHELPATMAQLELE